MADKTLHRESAALSDREVVQDDAVRLVTAKPVEPQPVRPDFAPAHYNLGNAHARRAEFALAIAHFERAVELEPGAERYRNNLERARAQLGR